MTNGEPNDAVIEASGFGKSFGGRAVLRDVDLTIGRGEIHGLVGQNGSGKSTLIKILAGYHAPDPGASLYVHGRRVDLPLAADAPARLGLRFVHQDLALLESGSVAENLLVGNYETRRFWRIPWGQEYRRAGDILRRFGVVADPEAPLSSLSEVERTILAIARAIAPLDPQRGGVLVLDEPTARLPRDTLEAFFTAVRDVASQGFGVLFVSHRLDEIVEVADRVTALRDGRVVAQRPTRGLTQRDLVAAILGFELADLYPEAHHPAGTTMLRVDGLSGGPVESVSFELHRGEILGVHGLRGMGHELVPHLMFGSIPARQGTMQLDGRTHDLVTMTPRKAMRAGLALLPANRLRHSGVGQATVAENMTLAIVGSFYRRGVLRLGREARAVDKLMRTFRVQPQAPQQPLAALSGGNQQKSLLAKWFARAPRVLLLEEPTNGVDVGAKKQIFQQIRDAAEAGGGILIASVESADLAQLCDRVLVFRDGRVVSRLHGSELNEARIIEQALMSQG